MKIHFNRISNKISGAEIYNVYLLKALKKYKDLHIYFSSDNLELNERIASLGISTEYIEPGLSEIGTKKHFLKALFLLPIYLNRFRKLFLKVGKVDYIILESITEKIFLTPLLRLNFKHIIWIEHGPLFVSNRAKIIKLFYIIASHFVQKIICVSANTKKDMIGGGVSERKLKVLYIGVDTEALVPLSRKEKQNVKKKLHIKSKYIIGFIGTLNREKGIENFISMAQEIAQRSSDISFLIVGTGGLKLSMETKVRKMHLENRIIFTGFQREIRKYVGVFDVLLFPTQHQEGLSISLVEAASLGVPIIATNIGGNKEIVADHKTGILYQISTPVSINRIYNFLIDSRKYKRNVRLIAKREFSLDRCGSSFYKFFQLYAK